jgi:hypothetical protein
MNALAAFATTSSVCFAIEGNFKFIPHERTRECEKSNPAHSLMHSE